MRGRYSRGCKKLCPTIATELLGVRIVSVASRTLHCHIFPLSRRQNGIKEYDGVSIFPLVPRQCPREK